MAGGRFEIELLLSAPLEDQSIHQARQRVVLAAENPDGLAAHELENPNVAQLEIVGRGGSKQRHEAGHAIGRIAHRTREDLVGSYGGSARDPIHDHRPVVELRPREQVLLRAIEQLGARGRVVERARDREILVGDDQHADHATEMLDAMPQQLLQCARVLAIVLVDREQEVESAAVDGLLARRRVLEAHPSFEGVEHRPQQARDHRSAVARALAVAELDHDGAERATVRAAQRRHEGRNARGRGLDFAAAGNRIGRSQAIEQPAQVRPLVAVGAPDELATRVIDRDAADARQQHLDELAIRRVAAGVPRSGGILGRARRWGTLAFGSAGRFRVLE